VRALRASTSRAAMNTDVAAMPTAVASTVAVNTSGWATSTTTANTSQAASHDSAKPSRPSSVTPEDAADHHRRQRHRRRAGRLEHDEVAVFVDDLPSDEQRHVDDRDQGRGEHRMAQQVAPPASPTTARKMIVNSGASTSACASSGVLHWCGSVRVDAGVPARPRAAGQERTDTTGQQQPPREGTLAWTGRHEAAQDA
jgi:hypothetical protein